MSVTRPHRRGSVIVVDAALTRLLEQVFATPDDDGVRAVVADALIERSDPRGEFIALQLRASLDEVQRERALELERAHGRAWADLPDIDNVEYRRGFPSLVRTSVFTDAIAWRTVETLVISHHVDPVSPFLSASPNLGSLRRLVNVRAVELAELSTWRTPRLEALELSNDLPLPVIGQLLGRPTITELAFGLTREDPQPPTFFWNRELLRQLRLVRFRALTVGSPPKLTTLAARSKPAGPVLRFESLLGFSVEFERGLLVARLASLAQLEAVAPQLFALIAANVPSVAKRFALLAGAQSVEAARVPKALRSFLTPPTPAADRTKRATAPTRARGASRGRATSGKS